MCLLFDVGQTLVTANLINFKRLAVGINEIGELIEFFHFVEKQEAVVRQIFVDPEFPVMFLDLQISVGDLNRLFPIGVKCRYNVPLFVIGLLVSRCDQSIEEDCCFPRLKHKLAWLIYLSVVFGIFGIVMRDRFSCFYNPDQVHCSRRVDDHGKLEHRAGFVG